MKIIYKFFAVSVFVSPLLSFAQTSPQAELLTAPILPSTPTTSGIQIVSPNGGEAWSITDGLTDTISGFEKFRHDIEWVGGSNTSDPYSVDAYLERLDGNKYTVVGVIPPFGYGSIQWVSGIVGKSNPKCTDYKYPSDKQCWYRNAKNVLTNLSIVKPGKYFVRIVDKKTGASDRSDKYFNLTKTLNVTSPASSISVDVNGVIDIKGSGFLAKGNSVSLTYNHCDQYPCYPSIVKGPFLVDSKANGTSISIPVSQFAFTDAEKAKYFGKPELFTLYLSRPDTGEGANIYVQFSEDQVADKIGVHYITLKKGLDKKSGETLTAEASINLRSEKNSKMVIPKTGAFYFLATNNTAKQGEFNSYASATTTYGKPVGNGVTDGGNVWIIKENTTVVFDPIPATSFNTRVMFAGSYTVSLGTVCFGTPDANGKGLLCQNVAKTLKNNKSNSVIIVGETSPYISFAGFEKTNNNKDNYEKFVIKGARFTPAGNQVFVGKLSLGVFNSTDESGTLINTKLTNKEVAENIQPATNSSCFLTIEKEGLKNYACTFRVENNRGISNNYHGVSVYIYNGPPSFPLKITVPEAGTSWSAGATKYVRTENNPQYDPHQLILVLLRDNENNKFYNITAQTNGYFSYLGQYTLDGWQGIPVNVPVNLPSATYGLYIAEADSNNNNGYLDDNKFVSGAVKVVVVATDETGVHTCPNLSSKVFNLNLTVGSNNDDVLLLQCYLISKGYLSSSIKSGYFGAQTKAALTSYQLSKGIVPADGYFGPLTRNAVNADLVKGVVPPYFTIVSKSISKSSTSPQNNISTSTVSATFSVKIKAIGGNMLFGTVGSNRPMFAATSTFFKIYKDGVPVSPVSPDFNVAQSVSYPVPSSGVVTAGLTNAFILEENQEITIPVTFMFVGRKSNGTLVSDGSYAVGLEGVAFSPTSNPNNVIIDNSMSGKSDWRTTTVSLASAGRQSLLAGIESAINALLGQIKALRK